MTGAEHIPPHVEDEAIEFVQGRLSPSRRGEVEAHLLGCGPCADYFRFVGHVQADLQRAHADHIRPDRLAMLADGWIEALEPSESDHLGACPRCAEDLAWARSAPAIPSTVVDPYPGPGTEARTPQSTTISVGSTVLGALRRLVPATGWARPASATVVAAGVVAAVLLLQPPDHPYASLADLQPLPAPQVTRDSGHSAAYEAALQHGAELYGAGRYDEAAARFRTALEQSPDDPDVQLYLASALLLTGQDGEAIPLLEEARRHARSPRLSEEIEWHLAHANLLRGEPEQARSALQRVIALDLDRRAEAEALLARIDAAR